MPRYMASKLVSAFLYVSVTTGKPYSMDSVRAAFKRRGWDYNDLFEMQEISKAGGKFRIPVYSIEEQILIECEIMNFDPVKYLKDNAL